MHPRGGKYTNTKSLFRGCTSSAPCSICGQCKGYRSRKLKCRQCYPWMAHCACGERGMSRLAEWVSQKLDRPLYSDDAASGTVQFHGDPAREYDQLIDKMVQEHE